MKDNKQKPITTNAEHTEQPKRSQSSVVKDNMIPPQQQSRTKLDQSIFFNQGEIAISSSNKKFNKKVKDKLHYAQTQSLILDSKTNIRK